MVSRSQAAFKASDYDAPTMSYDGKHGFPSSHAFVNLADTPKAWVRTNVSSGVIGSPNADDKEALHRKELRGSGDEYGDKETEVATPVKSFLNSNVTPRSGSRKARVGSASPSLKATPKATPAVERPLSVTQIRQSYPEPRGNGNSNGNSNGNCNGIIYKSPASAKHSRSPSMSSNGPGSSFIFRTIEPTRAFHETPNIPRANEACSNQQPLTNSANTMPKAWVRSPTSATETRPRGRSSAMSDHSSALEDTKTRPYNSIEPMEFMHTHVRAPTISGSSRPVLQTIYSEHPAAGTSLSRPSSPLKEEVLLQNATVAKASPRRHTRLLSSGGTEIKSPESASDGTNMSRRLSIDSLPSPKYKTHHRTSTAPTSGSTSARRLSIATADANHTDETRSPSAMDGSISSPESSHRTSTGGIPYTSHLRSQPSSPTKPQSHIDQLNELAANARRERKVLDLEISNSSLLAINQTLEREMKKQKAELRRYRRLSRTGKFSAPSSRSVNDEMSILSVTDTVVDSADFSDSDLGSGADLDEGEDEEDGRFNGSRSGSSGRHSSANRAAQRRFRDAIVEPLDLSNQRALLLESQKLNLSIKRCLGHSETLLTSAKNALAYETYRTDSEKIGPKVLTPDEEDDDIINRRRGLLSPMIPRGSAAVNPWERSLGPMASLDGGLETPDFSNWGPPTFAQPDETQSHELSNNEARNSKELRGGATIDGLKISMAHQIQPPTMLESGANIPTERGTEFQEPLASRAIAAPDVEIPEYALSPVEASESGKSKLPEVLQWADQSPENSVAEGLDPTNCDESKDGDDDTNVEAEDQEPSTKRYFNTPGNRSSIQNLGNYLQSFSIFNGGLRPP